MKVYIGPYKNYIGPYQIARGILFFLDRDSSAVEWLREFLAGEGTVKFNLLTRVCLWVESKRKRTVKVKVHDSDTWNADETLAHIILPVLRQLKKTAMGGPLVDDEDVPAHLHRPADLPNFEVDDKWHLRWYWVLDEMIHSFECKTDPTWDDKFFSNDFFKGDLDDPTWDLEKELARFDRVGYDKAQARISNGFRLFGKYYEALWS